MTERPCSQRGLKIFSEAAEKGAAACVTVMDDSSVVCCIVAFVTLLVIAFSTRRLNSSRTFSVIKFAVAALLLPIATSTAVATWSELQSSAVDGANLQVTANVTFTTSITVSGTLVISGETGQEILNGDDSVRFFYVNSAGTLGMNLLTLKNGRSGVAERITSNGGGTVHGGLTFDT